MSKFHINKKGVPAPCKAKKGKCPLGGADGKQNHFDSVEEAQAFADQENEKEYGIITNVQEDVAPVEEPKKGGGSGGGDGQKPKKKFKMDKALKPRETDTGNISSIKRNLRGISKTLSEYEEIYGIRTKDVMAGAEHTKVLPNDIVREWKNEKNDYDSAKKYLEEEIDRKIDTLVEIGEEESEKIQSRIDVYEKEYGITTEDMKAGKRTKDLDESSLEMWNHHLKDKEKMNKELDYLKARQAKLITEYESSKIKEEAPDLYLSEQESKELRERKGFLYRTIATRESDAVVRQVDDMDDYIESKARQYRLSSDDFWKAKPELKNSVDEFRKRGYLKNAGEKDAQYVAEVSTAMKIEAQAFFASKMLSR